jgi:hypothetical protein
MVERARLLAGAHASYLIATGVWPVVHRRSFEAVTGPKSDYWLVRTVGGLATAAGVTLGIAALRGRRPPEAVALAVSTGLVFGIADLRAARTESWIYLGDLGAQLVLVPAWLRRWKT